MDPSIQLYEQDAVGWQRGVYEDIKRTFRAPIVNWIFRTTMANIPDFLRYAWGQLKPTFQTRGFAEFSVAYRDIVLSVDAADEIPTYRPEQIGLRPPEYRDLQGQLATFDVVAPRLAVLFELAHRSLNDEPLGHRVDDRRQTTEPFPDWLDADRGIPPTMLSVDTIPDELDATIDELQAYHGLDEGLPSIYRSLGQWPSYLNHAWGDLEPVVTSSAFHRATDQADSRVDDFVETVPYRPRLAPSDLRTIGYDDDTIEAIREVFDAFKTGPADSVIPTLPVWAATVDAAGRRDL